MKTFQCDVFMKDGSSCIFGVSCQSGLASVNINLENNARQDRLAGVTVVEATTPIIIPEPESPSQMSSDLESLPSLGAIIIGRVEEDGSQSCKRRQSICDSLPSKR